MNMKNCLTRELTWEEENMFARIKDLVEDTTGKKVYHIITTPTKEDGEVLFGFKLALSHPRQHKHDTP